MRADLFPPDIVPIPLREDFIARVHIPLDLTEAEARKIANVVMAYASGIKTEGHDPAEGHGAKHESPAPKGDAPPSAAKEGQ